MRSKSRALVLASAVVLVFAHACGGDEGGVAGGSGASSGTGGGAGSDSGSGGSAGDAGPIIDSSTPQVESLTIEPASVTIDVTNGSSTPVALKAIAHYAGGTTAPVQADWSFDRVDLGIVSGSGSLSAHGTKGGTGTVTATVGSQSATAGATINLHFDDNSANLSQADQDKFKTPDANPSGTFLYPYDETVFARGILPPELMWSDGAAGDAYKIEIVDKNVTLTSYVNADPPSRYLMDKKWWEALTESSDGSPVSVKVQRLDGGGVAHQPMAETWSIAPGSLRGSIYYWAVNTGTLMKIAPGAGSPVPVFDPGPADQLGTPAPANYNNTTPPWESGGNNKRCVACHTVSKDGSTIATVFEKKGSTASPWGTVDLTQSTPSVTQITAYDSTTIYLAITPDGAYVVHNDLNMTMHLTDAKTGAPIASALDATSAVADPAFSPDGKRMAFSSNVVGSYPVEFNKADLDVFDFDAATQTFQNRQTIVPGGGQAIAFPSFSPDSKWIFYQKGDYSRAKYGAGGNMTGHDELYVTDVAKQVGELKLSAASGSTLAPRNQQRSYQPTVNPISVGGYVWVVFVSPRDYGNRMLSTTDATTENRKQLWVAAVDVNPTPGKDPSHPAFWLPGQDIDTVNMSGYWALEPCKQEGTSCDDGYECCTGFCRDQGNGTFACVPPPTNECAKIGEKCTTAADCCKPPSNVECIGGFCASPGPA
ncbi:MAG: PD40 domain-containing protein [Myxococcales bacterium]|nr:PD40 domain-containing protein [Myxococcales bacterium]MCB9580016.1 PD40 domain-containing protein [Polyangiaceae bacterium]